MFKSFIKDLSNKIGINQKNNCNINVFKDFRTGLLSNSYLQDENNSAKRPPMDKLSLKMKINADRISQQCLSIVKEADTQETALKMMNEIDLVALKKAYLIELDKAHRDEQFRFYNTIIVSLQTLNDHLTTFTDPEPISEKVVESSLSPNSDKNTLEPEHNSLVNDDSKESTQSKGKEKRVSIVKQLIQSMSRKSTKKSIQSSQNENQTSEKNENENQTSEKNENQTSDKNENQTSDKNENNEEKEIAPKTKSGSTEDKQDEDVVKDSATDEAKCNEEGEEGEQAEENEEEAEEIDIPVIEEDPTLTQLIDRKKELEFLIKELNHAFNRAHLLYETRNVGMTGEYEPVYFTHKGKLSEKVACQFLKGCDESIATSQIVCTSVTQSIDDYPPFSADNELISEVLCLTAGNEGRKEMTSPWSIILPVTAKRSNSYEICLLIFDDERWQPIDKVEVSYNLSDQAQSTATAIIIGQFPMCILAVTRPKREVFYVNQREGYKFMSSVNNQVTINIPAITDDKVSITEYSLRINTIKQELVDDWKEKGIPEIDEVDGISPIISLRADVTHPVNRVDAPVTVKVPLPTDTFADDEENRIPVIFPNMRDAAATSSVKGSEDNLKPFQQMLKQDKFIKENMEYKITLFLFDLELEKWKLWDKAVYEPIGPSTISVHLPNNGSFKFVAYRTRKGVKEDQLLKLSNIFRTSLSMRLVKILYGWQLKDMHQKCIVCLTPIPLVEKLIEVLKSKGYTAHEGRNPTVRIFERAKIKIHVGGNVLACDSNTNIFELFYNSRLRNLFEVTVKVADKYLQKSQGFYYGNLKFEIERVVVKKTGGRAVGRAPSVTTSVEREYLTDIDIRIPKQIISNSRLICPSKFDFEIENGLNTDKLERISSYICDEWQEVALNLGISQTTIETLRNTFPVDKQAFNMLLFWAKGLKMNHNSWDTLQNALTLTGYPNALFL